jgi:two-component system, OmpR family, phosphate regulon response regulator OmpR
MIVSGAAPYRAAALDSIRMKRAPVKILIVDDDRRTRTLLQTYLQELGFSVVGAGDGEQAEAILEKQKIDLLVLDLMLPGEDGLSICRRLRGRNVELPVIMLTARGSDVDRIVGLELGADDYLPKPFNPRELVARINAVLRRERRPPAGAPAEEEIVIRFGSCELNLGTRALSKSGEALPLTTGEYAVLEALVLHPRRPMSRDKLMAFARGREHGAFDRSMDVQVSRLRRLIEDDSAKPRYIQTVWGFGYVFVPDGRST